MPNVVALKLHAFIPEILLLKCTFATKTSDHFLHQRVMSSFIVLILLAKYFSSNSSTQDTSQGSSNAIPKKQACVPSLSLKTASECGTDFHLVE